MKKNIYALYHGDKFVDVGTAKEISDRQNISINALYSYMCSSWLSRRKDNWAIVIKLDDIDE